MLRRIDDDDLRRGLAIGLTTAAVGGLLISLLWQLLPLVQSGPPGSRFVAPIIALTLLITAPTGPATAVLYRRLAFRTVATVLFASTLIFLFVQIALLLAGWGIWALVVGYVGSSFVTVAFLLLAAHGLPMPAFRRPVLQFVRLSFPYQAPLMAQAAVGLIVSLLVAALLGARDVGFYAWSTILATPILTIIFTLEGVIAPSLARMLRDDGNQYGTATNVVLLTFAVLAATTFGTFIGLVPSIVRFIFGERWLPATGAVQMALAGVVPTSLVAGCASILASQDRPGGRLKSSIAAGIAALIFTAPLTLAAGVTGAAAVAYVISPIVEVIILASHAGAHMSQLLLRIGRIALPLATLSVVLERFSTSPESLALAVLVTMVAAVALLAATERQLVQIFWLKIRPRPATVA